MTLRITAAMSLCLLVGGDLPALGLECGQGTPAPSRVQAAPHGAVPGRPGLAPRPPGPFPPAGERPGMGDRPGFGSGRKPWGRPRWGSAPMPGLLFELAEKPPEEQDRILHANRRFREMPPEEQQHFREKLKRISAMTPDERQQLRERFEIFHRLPPEARDKIRDEVFPAWNRLPPERRRSLLEELRFVRRMRPEERAQHFGQDSFTRQFSHEEQQLLRQLISLSPWGMPDHPGPRPPR